MNRHLRAKRYWKKILSRMDTYMKMRAVNTWIENANLTFQERLEGEQDGNTEEIQQRKQFLTELETMQKEQEDEFE